MFAMQRIWRIVQAVLGLMLRHPVTGVCILGFFPNGDVVLVQRRDTGQWSLPGGIVDWGETITQALERELYEETGLTLVEVKRLNGVYSHPERDSRMHSICVSVVVEVQGECLVHDNLEILNVRGFPADQIPLEHLAHDHTRQIQDYLRGVTVLD